MTCDYPKWIERKTHDAWGRECLDILAPGQPVTHIHGTWIGFTEDGPNTSASN